MEYSSLRHRFLCKERLWGFFKIWTSDKLTIVPGPKKDKKGVSWLEVPDRGGLGRQQPGDPELKMLVST